MGPRTLAIEWFPRPRFVSPKTLVEDSDRKAVELQHEDVPFDMTPHVDSQSNTYDFGFGLNLSGQIEDARTTRHVKR